MVTAGKGLLFVYGTLLTGSETPANLWLERRIERVGEATIAGRLMGIPDRGGWYPALLPARTTTDRVRGLLFRHRLAASERRWLDEYEGDDYRLAPVVARVFGGRLVKAIAYRWRAPIPHDAKPIPQGDYLHWLRRTGKPPYCEALPRHILRARPFPRT